MNACEDIHQRCLSRITIPERVEKVYIRATFRFREEWLPWNARLFEIHWAVIALIRNERRRT